MRNKSVIILNLGQWFRRSRLKDFLSRALATLKFCGTEPNKFYAILEEGIMGNLHVNYFKFGLVVQEMSFKEKVYGQRTNHNSSP